MHKLTNLSLILLILWSCSSKEQNASSETAKVMFPERAKDMVIYEVNIRQYTPDGTFSAFAEHLPRLEELGVDILWVMPIQPIGEKNRKGGLGSYYSIKDYTAVNPDHGTLEDFKNMVNAAHERGMLVILDWVANHTAFDHEWAKIDGYHTTDSLGNIIWPKDTDWTDVADLNYDNMDMQNDMIQEMKWWVTEADIDGFRCDVAGFVPMKFWSRAKDSLDVAKDLFMLAEWDDPEMHSVFHMTYGWGMHHQMNEVAKGQIDTNDLSKFVNEDNERYGPKAIRMNFTTNHDENSWNGTVFERFGGGHKAYAVFAFTIQGMPLIYSGQEAGLDRRLAFFDKDSIDWSDVKYQDFYSSLVDLKKSNPALFNGEYGGKASFINTGNANVIAYSRTKENNTVTVLINLSDQEQEIDLTSTNLEFQDYFTKEDVNSELSSMTPFQYLVGSN